MVSLAASQVSLRASGFVQFSLGGVAGFRIEGSILVSASANGFTVAVDGLLLVLFDPNPSDSTPPMTLLRLNAFGGLQITNVGISSAPVYTIAGKLSVSRSSNSVLDGNGFTFSASLSLEVNTTNQAIDLDGNGSVDLAAGIYVRVHADGSAGTASERR